MTRDKTNDVRGQIGGFTVRREYLDIAQLMTPKNRKQFVLAIIEAGLNDVWPEKTSPLFGPIETLRNQINVGRNNWVKAYMRRKKSGCETADESGCETADESGCVHNNTKEQSSLQITSGAAVTKWTIEQFVSAGMTAGVPEWFCREKWKDIEVRGWTDERGRRTLTSPRGYLKTAWGNEQKKIRAARADLGPLGFGLGVDIAR